MQSVWFAVFVKEDMVHFVLECSWLDPVRQKYLMKIQSILSQIDAGVSIEMMSNLELLKQLLMDSTCLGVLKDGQVNNNTYVELESASRKMCLLRIQKGYNS